MADIDVDLESLVVLARTIASAAVESSHTHFDGADVSASAGHAAVASALADCAPAWRELRGSLAGNVDGIGRSLVLIASEFESADNALARITAEIRLPTKVTRSGS